MAIWKKRLFAFAGALILTLTLGEIALRVLGISFQDFYQVDPVRGIAHRPGSRGWFHREGRQYIVINPDGFRDRRHAYRKPPGTLRIAVLGDSFAEAFQVPMAKTFWAVLERELSRCPSLGGRTVEVLNFGVSNYGTAQELLTLRQRVWDYSPDLVLLAFFTGNDVWDNSRALKNDSEIPYFVIKDGELVLDDSFRNSARQRAGRSRPRALLRACIESSRLLQLVRQAWGVTLARTQPSRASGSTRSDNELDVTWPLNPIYREPADPAWRGAWQVTERALVQMHEDVVRKGAKFLVVTLSNGVQVHPDPVVGERLQRALGVGDLFYPDRRIRELGRREGFGVLNLAPPFRRFALEHHVFLHGFGVTQGSGHWNEAGHQRAGQLIATWICEQYGTARTAYPSAARKDWLER